MGINIRRVFYLTLFIIGLSQIVPGHNISSYLPPFKVVIDECDLSNPHWKIRLYEQSLGATTSYSYSITAQKNYFATENIIYDTYGFPVIKTLSCDDDILQIMAISDNQGKSISSNEISELVHNPIELYYGKPQANGTGRELHRNLDFYFRLLNIICCFPFLIPGFFLVLSSYRKRTKENLSKDSIA